MGDAVAYTSSSDTRRLVLALFAVLLPTLALTPGNARGIPQAAPQRTPPTVGTIQSISGNSLVLKTDSGAEVKVQLSAEVRVVRVAPGSVDLRAATAIPLSSLQVGDRILVRGKPVDEAGAFVASMVVAMKKEDIAEKQAREREEWQLHGIGGLVKSVDAANSSIVISRVSATGLKEVLIHAPTGTILRRYAPGSIRFDEAKVAPLAEIHEGDQLRARGARSADGNEFTADEVVSGSFRNVAGAIVAVNPGSGTLTVSDLATKQPVELKVTGDSQMRKLPQPMAQRIVMRLKGGAPEGSAGQAVGAAGSKAGAPSAAAAANTGAGAGAGGPPHNGGGDIQQMLNRLPVSPLSDFQKGDVVMIVATGGQEKGQATVITLLGGVEPILQGSTQGQAASILSPWSLSEGGSDAGTP